MPFERHVEGIVHWLQELNRCRRVCDPVPTVTVRELEVLGVAIVKISEMLEERRPPR